MAELYLFDQDDNFITILSKDAGLVDSWFKDYQNHIPDEPFLFNVDSNSPLLQHIVEENQVAFYDRDGDLRLVRMKELYEVSTKDGHNIRVKCEPSFLELYDHFIEDRRIINGAAQTALDRALDGSRYIGEVTVDLGLATDNFYWIDGIEAVFKILGTWGGALKDTITLNDKNEIIERKLWIVQRLGTDNGLIVEPDYNAEMISRNTLSYTETALWAQGASLETDNGGYTRYITFEDVEWSKSKGDPVDKPKGQKWVGDPQALATDGLLHNGVRKHKFGHYNNIEIEDPEELLMATWQELQERKLKEIIHEATIYESDKKVSLGDTVTILNRKYNKPIELQSQITGLEYDVLEPDDEVKIIVGKYIDMNEDPLQKEVDDLKEQVKKPRPTTVTDGSYPDRKPSTPVNVEAIGGIETIQLYWDYADEIFIKHYEVYGSQIKDFVPDEQHLLWRGQVSTFAHTVGTDQKWYYRIRAVNYQGRPSDWSVQAEASTRRVISDDILFGEILSDHLSDNLDIADKLAQNTIDRINAGPMEAIEYTQEEIEATENRLLEQLNNEIGDVNGSIANLLERTSGIEGTVTNIERNIDTIEGTLSTTITQLTNLDDVVSQHTLDIKANAEGLSAKAEKSEVYTRTATDNLLSDKVDLTVYNNKVTQLDIDISGISGRVSNTETNINDLTGEMSSALSQIGELDIRADKVEINVSEVRADLGGLEIGGRNLIKGSSEPFIVKPKNTGFNYEIIYTGLERNTTFTFSAKVEKLEGDFDIVSVYPYKASGEAMKREDVPIIDSKIVFTFETDGRYDYNLLVYAGKSGETHNNSVKLTEYQLEKGNKATDWTPAPEDVDNRITAAEGSITTLAGQVELKASQTSVNSLTGRMSNAESSITTNANNIKLKVDVDGVIASINLSKEGVRIDGNKHHITGQTLIDDAVIGTGAIANAAIKRAHLQDAIITTAHVDYLSGTKLVAGTVDADRLNVANLAAITANLGSVTGGKITQKSGNGRIEMFDGDLRSFYKNDLALEISDYKMRFFNEDESEIGAIYPVTSLASGEKGMAIEVSDNSYLSVGPKVDGIVYPSISIIPQENRTYIAGPYSGLNPETRLELYANRRHLSGEVDYRSIDQPSIIMSQGSGTNDMMQYFGGTNRRSNALWQVRWRESPDVSLRRIEANKDGVHLSGIVTGSSSATGNILGSGGQPYYENGSGSNSLNRVGALEAGGLVANFGNTHVYIGMRGGGELRATDSYGRNYDELGAGKITYRDVRASDFINASSIEYKTNIVDFEGSALNIINDLKVVNYNLKDDLARGINKVKIGFISEHNPEIATDDHMAIETYKLTSLQTKAIQEVDLKFTDKIIKIEDWIYKKDLQIQYLQQKVKQQEERIKQLEEMVA